MKNGRSKYTFELNCNLNLINNLIQSYIKGNQFELRQEKDEQFYIAGDAMIGYRCFNYSISDKTLTIYAWFKGTFGNSEWSIEQNNLNIMAMNYRNSLNTLFQEINKLNNGGVIMNNNNMNFDPNTGQPLNQNNNQQSFQNNTTQTFQDETAKKQEKMCEIGFWLSVLGILLSFIGMAYGILIYIMNFYFASQGLKTRKRKKAIATIVLSIISIIIIIFQLVK